jgi:hypothetical protein
MLLLDLINAVSPAIETAILLAVLWLLYRAATGSWRIWHLAVGLDGRYSTSLFQGLAWTMVVVASYVLLFLCRVHVGSTAPLGDLPTNVITALGLSLGTTVAAAGITTGRVSRDRSFKTPAAEGERRFANLIEDDTLQPSLVPQPSLVKTQLMVWTLVSLGVYIVAVADAASKTLGAANGAVLPGLPDIDTTLLVLSGIGQATYLTHKAVATPGTSSPGFRGADASASRATMSASQVPVANRPAAPSSAELSGTIDAAMHAAVTAPGSVRVPKFKASVNGLQFVNSFPHEGVLQVDLPGIGSLPIGDASNGLCGGMTYTVRDVFQTPDLAPIAATAVPAEGSPLYRYIVERLIDSFDIPGLGFLQYYEWMTTPDGDAGWPPLLMRRGVAWKTIVEEWAGRIRPELDAGRLCCLGLVTVTSTNPGDLGRNHQVLAYGYDLDASGNLKVLVYDPNTEMAQADQVAISLNISHPEQVTPIAHNVAIGDPIRGFFRTDYGYRNPTGLVG